jgi:hypothetical protein
MKIGSFMIERKRCISFFDYGKNSKEYIFINKQRGEDVDKAKKNKKKRSLKRAQEIMYGRDFQRADRVSGFKEK